MSGHFDRAGPGNKATNLHETPPELVYALADCETLPRRIWEPACGHNAVTRVLEELGHDVRATDVARGPRAERIDYLAETPRWARGRAVVTNPPFPLAAQFAAKAIADGAPLVCLLLRVGFLAAGIGRTEAAAARRVVLDNYAPARVHVFRRRPRRMHRSDWKGPKASATLDLCWIVWSSQQPTGPTIVDRIDWRDIAAAPLATANVSSRDGGGGESRRQR